MTLCTLQPTARSNLKLWIGRVLPTVIVRKDSSDVMKSEGGGRSIFGAPRQAPADHDHPAIKLWFCFSASSFSPPLALSRATTTPASLQAVPGAATPSHPPLILDNTRL